MSFFALWSAVSMLLFTAVASATHTTAPRLDQALQRWLHTLKQAPSPHDYAPDNLAHDLSGQETVAAYLALREAHELTEKETLSESFLQKLQQHQVAHAMNPYFFEEISELDKYQHLFQFDNLTELFATRSCPARRILREALANKEKLSLAELRQTVPWIASFQNRKFKYYTFMKILRILHKTKTKFPAELMPHLHAFPNLKIGFHSIMPRTTIATVPRITYLLQDRKCSSAYAVLSKSNLQLGKFKELALQVAKCYRRHRRFSQLKFWRNLRSLMHKKFQFAGWAVATIRMAELHRYRDRFQQATNLLQQVHRKAKKRGAQAELDAGLFALAQVKEHQKFFVKARRLYRQHIEQFPNSPQHETALKSLALLLLIDTQWEQAEHVLARLRQHQESLPRDMRRESLLGFALLWQGRAALELGNTQMAKAAWARLQREFFSSYQGALAHHMLEKISDRAIPVAPLSQAVFEERMLYDPFDRQAQVQVARALYLLRLGMNKEAICEIKEQPATGNAQMYVKALLLHAAGDWLTAIRTFNAIDRSYRELLPAGSEKILFPKRFETEIFTYARKVNVDPFLAMALIRQESVFNPRARSSADARGLMQIMPRTARHEALRLKKSYISAHEKKRIKRAVRSSKNNLFDVSTNVLLGVHYLHRLLNKYKDTVHTLSSYNAGITPVNRWLKNFPATDPMLFIDKIPWRETRNYVKLVLRNYFYYKRWYLHDADSHHDHLAPVVRVALKLPDPP